MDTNGVALSETISSGYSSNTSTLNGYRAAGTYGDVVVDFSTGGGAAVSAPTVTILNDNDINVGVIPQLDWTWQAGTTSYNIYRTTVTAGVVTEALADQANVTVSEYTPGAAPGYVSGELAVTYDYVVKAVNSDGTESAGSTAVTANDVIGPKVTSVLCNGGGAGADIVRVTFDEDVAEAAAETIANYTITLDPSTTTVSSVSASKSRVKALLFLPGLYYILSLKTSGL